MGKRYEATWNSLSTHPVPQWFRDAKFGIYTHWGPYSVPAHGWNASWYPTQMYNDPAKDGNARYHEATYGPASKFGYKDFIPMFTGEKFNAEEWADLFARAGAKFAGPVAEHHDGFALWGSKLTKWNAVNMGPKRDVVAELDKAYRAKGMKFIATFHHAHNWWFFPTWNKNFDCSNPEYAGLYSRPHEKDERPDKEYLDIWKGKLFEVIDRHRPDLIWFDFGLARIKESYRKEFLAYYYNKAEEWGKDVAVTFKTMKECMHLPPMTGIADIEVGKMNETTHYPWLTDSTIDAGEGWGHVNGLGYKSPERLIHNLIDRVSKNGYLLLNVGPRADGTIPEGAQECLREMGRWLEINGEAIYGTTPWMMSGEGPTKVVGGGHFSEENEVRFTSRDIRYTVKGDDLYAIVLGPPGDEVILQKAVAPEGKYPDEITGVELLGVEGRLPYRSNTDGLVITMPKKMPCNHAVVLKLLGPKQQALGN